MKFPKVPELDWLRLLAEDMMCDADERVSNQALKLQWKNGQRLTRLYKYLLWSRRYAIMGRDRGTTPEYQVAYGFVVKYHRLLFEIPLSDGEKILVTKSEKALKAK